MELSKGKRKFAEKQCIEMIREFVCTLDEETLLKDEQIVEKFNDCFNIGMDMFQLGLEASSL